MTATETHVLDMPVDEKRSTRLVAQCTHLGSGLPTDDWTFYRGDEGLGYDFVAWFRRTGIAATRLGWDRPYSPITAEVLEDIDDAPMHSGSPSLLQVTLPTGPPITKKRAGAYDVVPVDLRFSSELRLRTWSRGPLWKFISPIHKGLYIVVACQPSDSRMPLETWYFFEGKDNLGFANYCVFARQGRPLIAQLDTKKKMVMIRDTLARDSAIPSWAIERCEFAVSCHN